MVEAADFVVVGGGIAGVSCVQSIFILHPEASVILISATPIVKVVTSISAYTSLLAEYNIEEKSHEYLSNLNSSLKVLIDTVVSLNSNTRVVRTYNNRSIKYGSLCLCIGASPKVVIPNNDFVIGIRDTDSAIRLQKKVERARRIVVIGNGGIATELVYELKNVQLIWAIKDKHISATFVDPGAAEFFRGDLENESEGGSDEGNRSSSSSHRLFKRLKYTSEEAQQSFMPGAALGPNWHDKIKLEGASPNRRQLTVEYDTELQCIKYANDTTSAEDGEEEKWPIYATLTNGKVYGCDFIISATGVTPNSANVVLENDGAKFDLASDGGIKVDEKMQTSVEGIYAAGDVCSACWEKARHWFQMRLWTQARQMGCYAAKSMVGFHKGEPVVQDFCFELFTHVTRLFGYKVILLGLFNGQTLSHSDYELMVRITKGKEYVKLVMLNGRLEGAVLIGDTDLEEMCENLILNQLDLTMYGTDLLNPMIDIEDYFD